MLPEWLVSTIHSLHSRSLPLVPDDQDDLSWHTNYYEEGGDHYSGDGNADDDPNNEIYDGNNNRELKVEIKYI